MLKSKIHRVKVTQAELLYEGSLTIDQDLMDEADILSFEKVAVVNINNGERFETYAIPGERGTGIICLNGGAARKGNPGDEIIIFSYVNITDDELKDYKPIIVHVDKNNKISR